MKLFLVSFLVFLIPACSQHKPISLAENSVEVPTIEPAVSFDVDESVQCVSVLGVGDIMLGGTAEPTLRERGYDYPFEATKKLIHSADIAVANLETALTLRGQPFDKKYNFRNPPDLVVPALKRAGFDLVGLANNHSVDYGHEGLQDTLNALSSMELPAVGAGMNLSQARAAHIVEAKGQKVGFLAYSLTFPEEFWATDQRPGTAFGHADHIREDVEALKAQVHNVVVQFHWGREGTTKLRDYQVALGRAAIDAGAAAVFGHHPHVLQGIEQYKHGVIYYSLGNFAFGSFSNRVQTGGVAKVQLCEEGLEKYALTVVDVNNYRVRFQPTEVSDDVLKEEFSIVKSLAEDRLTKLELVGREIIGYMAEPHSAEQEPKLGMVFDD